MELRTGNNLSEQLFAQILNSGSKGGHANLTVCAPLYRIHSPYFKVDQISKYNSSELHKPIIYDLGWLIPLNKFIIEML